MPSSGLGGRVQRIVDLVSVGLAHAPSVTSWPSTPSEGRLGYQMAPPDDQPSADVQQIWSAWILGNGFRDISELVGDVLERAYTVLAHMAAISRPTNTHATTHYPEAEIDGSAAGRLHTRGLPAKLHYLDQEFGFSLPDNFRDYALSINAVRNCLVHRNGRVQEKDVKDDQVLSLYWQPLKILALGPDGEREVKLGEAVRGGEKMSVMHRRQCKPFPLGSRIVLAPEEFAEVAWTVFRFGAVVDEALETYAHSRGVSIVPSDTLSD